MWKVKTTKPRSLKMDIELIFKQIVMLAIVATIVGLGIYTRWFV